MLRSLACCAVTTAAAVGMGLAAAPSVKADIITKTFTFPTLGPTNDGQLFGTGSEFDAFNPALGTLASVTFDVTATADFTGGGSTHSNQAEYQWFFTGKEISTADTFSPAIEGDGQVQVVLYSTIGDALDPFIGVFPIVPSVSIALRTPASFESFFGKESVIYSYVPATVTRSSSIPEPSTWAMMLIGFAGLGFLGYRHTRKGQATTRS